MAAESRSLMPGASKELRELVLRPLGSTSRHLQEVVAALWQNQREIPYAWKILCRGVCDGCSFGSAGLYNAVPPGLHSCVPRLRLLRRNTIGPLAPAALSDVQRLRRYDLRQLRSLGRLAHPLIRRKGQRGFLRVSWDEAIGVIAQAIRQVRPHETAFLATGQGLTNESYYVFQKLARAVGTNNLDLCSRLRGADALAALKTAFGFAASTCSVDDAIGTDLVVSFGSDRSAVNETLEHYLRRASRAGARVLTLQSTEPAGGGRQAAEDPGRVRLQPAGEAAFLYGALKFLILAERVNLPFIEQHTEGFAELAAALSALRWEQLEERSGVAREAMQRFAESYSSARSAVFVYREAFDAGAADAIVNLALARGMIGKEKCGILAVRDQSAEQGALECGMAPDVFPGGFMVGEASARRFSNLWHHPIPSQPGLGASAMMPAAEAGRIKVLYALGCDLLEGARDPARAETTWSQIPVRVHQDLMLNTSMLLDGAEAVVLLPGQTRYEQRTGGISTNTERRIRFTPEIRGRRIGQALPDWEIPMLIGRRAMSNGDKLFPYAGTAAIREEMSRVMPIYRGVEQLSREGDQLQWGGARLYGEGFTAMPQGRALFAPLEIP